jgi:hypothetical protein
MKISPETSLLTVPYSGDRAEFAWKVRETISGLKDENPVIVVDLPEGYEEQVLKSVKRLPAISLLVDPLRRGIVVHPCHPAMEAVRSFLEWGSDLFFVDTCFPCIGAGDTWNRFQASVSQFGFDHTLEHAEEYGIDLPALIGITQEERKPEPCLPFHDDPDLEDGTGLPLQEERNLPYFVSRQRYMASRLLGIISQARGPVVFVCNSRHLSPVLEFMKREESAPVMPVHIPVTVCRVRESSIPLITREIPFFIYMYELYRDTRPDRNAWIHRIASDATDTEGSSDIERMIQFAGKVSLAEGMRYPDMSIFTMSALSCCSPEYVERFLDIALRYPPADPNPNCEIIPVMDMNHSAFVSGKYLGWIRKYHNPLPSGKNQKMPESSPVSSTFTRTKKSLADERDWVRYFTARFRSMIPGSTCYPAPYSAGMAEGVDLHETVRHLSSDEIFVQEREIENRASFVFYFGGDPTWQIYYDKQNLMAATARREGNQFTVTSLVTFFRPVPIMEIYHEVHTWDPLYSAVRVALSHNRHVFLFSHEKPDLSRFGSDSRRIHWVCLDTIPVSMQEKIRVFHVT